MKNTVFIAILFLSLVVFSAEHGHVDESHIPLHEIGWQALNLGILLVAIFFLIRKSIIEAFANRRQNFVEQSEKTQVALKQAEQSLSEIKLRFSSLEASEKISLENAKREAQVQKENLIKEAHEAVEKMKKDAQQMMANELIKAKNEINTLIMTQAVQLTKQNLSKNQAAGATTQEAHFIKQLEQVKA